MLCGCCEREKAYYKERSNYITEEAVVEQISFDEELHRLYFTLSGINEKYQDDFFKVQGDSVDILLNHDILNQIKPGSVITYTSAPHYFGDGYCMPIVEVHYDGEEFLSFEDGYNNLMELY